MALPHKSIPLTRSSRVPQWHDSIVRGAPDRRSPHFSTITTSHRPPPQASHYTPSPRPYPPLGSNPSSLPPTTLCPRLLPPPFPLPPGPSLLDPSSDTPPVNHTFHFGSPSTAYTGPVIHCLPPCPFCLSSVLQTSIGPGLLIASAFYTPPAHN